MKIQLKKIFFYPGNAKYLSTNAKISMILVLECWHHNLFGP